jgi:hypothetical protein
VEETAMSLLTEAMEPCCYIDKTTQNDGYGGVETVWLDGADFNAAFVIDTSLQARVAEKQGVKGFYTITTEKIINLQFHDVVKRKSDGKIFRVLSKGDDKHTPDSAGLNMRQVQAEEYELIGQVLHSVLSHE